MAEVDLGSHWRYFHAYPSLLNKKIKHLLFKKDERWIEKRMCNIKVRIVKEINIVMSIKKSLFILK